MNEQTPTWSCPVCQRRIENWEDLIVDEFFSQMLMNTPKHIDSVRVEPSGIVTIIDENPDLADEESEQEEEPNVKPEPEVTILLDDDDEEPIIDKRKLSPSLSEPQARKKQKSDVIDLTLDSEDEEGAAIKSRSSR